LAVNRVPVGRRLSVDTVALHDVVDTAAELFGAQSPVHAPLVVPGGVGVHLEDATQQGLVATPDKINEPVRDVRTDRKSRVHPT